MQRFLLELRVGVPATTETPSHVLEFWTYKNFLHVFLSSEKELNSGCSTLKYSKIFSLTNEPSTPINSQVFEFEDFERLHFSRRHEQHHLDLLKP